MEDSPSKAPNKHPLSQQELHEFMTTPPAKGATGDAANKAPAVAAGAAQYLADPPAKRQPAHHRYRRGSCAVSTIRREGATGRAWPPSQPGLPTRGPTTLPRPSGRRVQRADRKQGRLDVRTTFDPQASHAGRATTAWLPDGKSASTRRQARALKAKAPQSGAPQANARAGRVYAVRSPHGSGGSGWHTHCNLVQTSTTLRP